MSKLTSLAPEVLYAILHYLSPQDLTSLGLTNKALCPHIEPILYHSIHHTLKDNFGDTSPRLPLLIRTLVSRPDLALHIKQVQIRSGTAPERLHIYENRDFEDIEPYFNYSDEIFRKIQTCAYQVPKQNIYIHDFNAQLAKGNSDAITAILLSKLSNLQVLSLDLSFARRTPYVRSLLSHANCECLKDTGGEFHDFRRLKEVRIPNDVDRACMDFENPLNYWPLNISSLEKLDMTFSETRQSSISIPPRVLPSLRSLCLNNSTVGVSTLSEMLLCTPSLQTLEYHFIQRLDDCRNPALPEHKHKNEWADLTTALLPLTSNLQNLIISVDFIPLTQPFNDDDDEYAVGVWKRRGSMGSLKAFTALKRLEVPTFVLLGWVPRDSGELCDILPEGLEELCLRDDLVDLDINFAYPWNPWFRFPDDGNIDQEAEAEISDENIGDEDENEEVTERQLTGKELEERFDEDCDPTPTLDQLGALLTEVRSQGFSLRSVMIKNLQGRAWPPNYERKLAVMCTGAQVECIFLGRLTNYSDDVRETRIQEVEWMGSDLRRVWKMFKFRQRLIFEKRGTFYERLATMRGEEELKSEVLDLVNSGWFENYPTASSKQESKIGERKFPSGF